MIKIAVRDIKNEGLDIDQTLPIEGVGLSAEEVDIRGTVNVKAHLSKEDGYIIAETEVKADFGNLCARCLEPLYFVEVRPYTFEFELTEDQEYVDLGEEIRQEMILGLPPKILCKEDCKGICPKCGVNLNIEPCKCK